MTSTGNSRADSAPRPLSRRRVVYALVTILFLGLTAYPWVIPVFRAALLDYFAINKAQFGWLMSVSALFTAISALAGGVLTDRWGPRAMLRWLLPGMGLGLGLWGVAGRSWTLMLIGAGVQGLCGGALAIAVPAYLVRLFRQRPRRILTLQMVVLSIFDISFTIAAEAMLHAAKTHASLSFGLIFHGPVLIIAVLLLSAIPFYRRRKAFATPPPATARQRGALPRFLPSAAGLFLAAVLIVHCVSDSAAFSFLPLMLAGASFPAVVILPGVVLAGSKAAYIISRALLAVLPERTGRRAMLVAPGLFGGACFIAGLLSRSQLLAGMGYIVGAFLWSCEYPAMIAMLAEREKQRFGAALTVVKIGEGLGGFLVLPWLGGLGDRLGDAQLWKVVLIPACGFPLVGLGGALWLLLFWRRHPVREDPRFIS